MLYDFPLQNGWTSPRSFHSVSIGKESQVARLAIWQNHFTPQVDHLGGVRLQRQSLLLPRFAQAQPKMGYGAFNWRWPDKMLPSAQDPSSQVSTR